MKKYFAYISIVLLFISSVDADASITDKNLNFTFNSPLGDTACPDFSFRQNICNPLVVDFFAVNSSATDYYWEFENGQVVTGLANPSFTFSGTGTYTIKHASVGACVDTITKIININLQPQSFISISDSTVCQDGNLTITTLPALGYCWTPSIYLDNPLAASPVCTPLQTTTYFVQAKTQGANLLINGDFNMGNVGFISDYMYASNFTNAGQYFVGNDPSIWNAGLRNCVDHSTGIDSMLIVSSSNALNQIVWKSTINVIPNTNYVFAAWIQALSASNGADLRLSINGNEMGNMQTSATPCVWDQFYTEWNSGNSSTADIAIINKNSLAEENNFALDDISFAPLLIVRDSITIYVDSPFVNTIVDTAICRGTQIVLTTNSNVSQFKWTPASAINNTTLSNPLVSPASNTWYHVKASSIYGCEAEDSVFVEIKPSPVIIKTPDTVICKNASVQLNVSGATGYQWTPNVTLSNDAISNPMATPTAATTYYVTSSDPAFVCSSIDSIRVSIRAIFNFTISAPDSVCKNNAVQLVTTGGNVFSWQPSNLLIQNNIANPIAVLKSTTTFIVNIEDSVCKDKGILYKTIYVKPLPNLILSKSNDIDCYHFDAKLQVSGADKYLWYSDKQPIYLSDSSISNPIAFPSATRKYYVVGTDTISTCSKTDSIIVYSYIKGVPPIFAPNAFSPNNDGLNDCWKATPESAITNYELTIFSRWGDKIFYTTNVNACWDGTCKGVPQDPGNYVYCIKYGNNCLKNTESGNLLLLR